MRINDAVHGANEIDEPVLLQLLQSDAMQRLAGVAQHGITAHLGITAPFSRLDHCIGTLLLVRRLGGGLEEQIAALLHDVSHTAFSHVIDYVFEDHLQQGYHDRHKLSHVAASDLPRRLQRYGYDWRAFMDETRFPLLEQPAPALCADRLDYFLRDLEFMHLATVDEIQRALDTLVVVNGRIAVGDPDIARWLAYTYIEVDRESWSHPREVGLYQLTAEAIRAGFEAGVLQQADLWGTDNALWDKLRDSDHPAVHERISLVSPATRFPERRDSPKLRLSSKVRSIDPPVATGEGLIPLSDLDSEFNAHLAAYHAAKKGGYALDVVAI